MKTRTITKNSGLGFSSGLLRWCVILIALLTSSLSMNAQRNYAFPQNYKYPNGQIYTGSDVQTKIQGLFNSWKTTYYVEGSIGGTPCARIKFQQPGQDGSLTVSEGIAYGMLIFVYMDNASNSTQDEFNKLWTYYQKNTTDGQVMNWKVNGFTGAVASGTGNEHGATDADIDVATALLLAHKQWGSTTVDYLAAAKTLMNTIYSFEVDGNMLLKPGNAFNDYANPSYYITNALELFGKVEGSTRWAPVITACYKLMNASKNGTTGFVPDWTTTPAGGAINGIVSDKFESYFLYDAIRIPWRMAQAYAWYGHADAKTIASKTTAWAIANHPDPALIWDGYLIGGGQFNNPTGNANFTNLGKNHNPCFSGGLGVGCTVDPAASGFTTYLGKVWNVGSAADPYGAYFTNTTQLLYMLFMTGNMPNLWDMKPLPTAAETDAVGRVISIDFSKALAATTSTTGWLVETFADSADLVANSPTTIAVSSIAVSGTRVTITLAADIAEQFIRVTYTGTTIKSSADNLTADAFTRFAVTNKITSMEPLPVSKFTDVLGTMVKITWSKAIKPSSIVPANFTVKVNTKLTTVTGVTIDASDSLVTNIAITGGSITSVTDVITVTFTGGSITGTGSAKTAKAFTDAPVQNFYMNVSCYTLTNFDANPFIVMASWVTGVWSNAGTDPASTTNKVGYFKGDNTTKYLSTKGTFSLANQPAFVAALGQTGAMLKFRYYVKSATFAASEKLKIVFAQAALADAGSYYDPDEIAFTIAPTATNAWVSVSLPINGVKNTKYDFIQLGTDIGNAATKAEFYIDDLQICPPPPTVNFVNGRTSFDGTQVEVRFSTGMKVPTSASEISVFVDGVASTVTSITAKQGDATFLVLNLSSAITDPAAVVTVSGGGTTGLKSVNSTPAEVFNGAIANLVGISVTTGWRDDFASTTDFITANLGAGVSYTPAPVESATAPGTYSVTIDGTAGWSTLDVTTYGTGAKDMKQVMDLTGREKVQIRYKVPSATSTKLYLRISCKDKVNGNASDGMTFLPLTFTAGATTWNDLTVDLSATLIKKYDANGNAYSTPLVVDRTNIYQVMFCFVEAEGTATSVPAYTPKQFKGKIDFDYISIGSALVLTGVPATVNEGQAVAATSSATGQIFLVPANTPPMLKALQDSVFAGRGVVVTSTAAVATTIATTILPAGYYEAYAYDPQAGALSAKVGVNILDITKPIISAPSTGNFSATSTVTATVNENATLYLIPSTGVTLTDIADIINKAVYNVGVTKNVAASILLSNITPAVTLGQKFVFVAADYAYPTPNISAVTSPVITIVDLPLTMSVTPTGAVESGKDVTVSVSRSATAYLIPSTVLVASQSDLNNPAKSVAITSLSGTISTTGVALGTYYVYVSDGVTIIGPSAMITVSDVTPPVLSAFTSGSVAITNGTISATSNETGNLYLIKEADIGKISTVATLTANAVVTKAATAGVAVSFAANTSPIVVGTYVLFAADAAGNISTATPVFTVDIGCQAITSITVIPATLSIKEGSNATLTITGYLPASATAIDNSKTTWIADVSADVTIVNNFDGTCKVTGVLAGSLNITCTITDCLGNKITFKVPTTITPLVVCPSAISIAPTTQDIQMGTPGSLTTTITGSLGASNVSWSSASPAIASIGTSSNTTATITPATLGTTMITASVLCNSVTISGTATVNVVKTPVTSISVTSSNPVSIAVNSTAQITASALPTIATYKTLSYTSSTPSIASVDAATGLITAKAVGSCTITVASTDAPTVTKVITVNVTALLVSALTASPSTVTVSMGSTGTSTIIFNPLNASNKSVTITADATLVTAIYNGTTNVLSITGVNLTSGTPVTVMSVDGPSVTLNVIVTCPTVAPTATEVPNVSTCTSAPAPLVATFTSPTAKAVWYSVQTGGTALSTGNTYSHGKTGSGVSSYYVAQTDNGCESSNRVTVTLTINANPVPTITTPTTAQAFCITNTTASTLAATPTAGTFTIDGTTQTKLNPSTLSAGSHTVAYSVTSLGCTGTASTSVTIDAAPAISITSVPTLCSTGSVVALSATPTGGTWSGTAVTGSSFNPAIATAGANTATYTAISGSCTVTKDLTITVNTTPAPSFSGLPAAICKGAAALALPSYVSIANGTFTDNLANVSGSTFTPTNIGKSTITYSVTSGGCVGTKSAVVTVNDVPSITITPIGTICSNAGKQTLVATPANGTWSGSTAITGTQFDPSAVSAGSYPISYAYTDGTTTCSSSKSITVVVNNAPVPTAQNASINVGGTPSAIIATGTGVITWYSADKTTVLTTGASYTPTDPTTTNGTIYTYYISNTINGCESDKVAVTLSVTSCTTLAPTAASVLTVCEGVTIPALTATGTSLKWYQADGTTLLSSGPSYTTTVTSVGTHTFKVSQTLNGCEGTQASASVTIESKPVVLTIANASVCEGSTAVALTTTSTGTVTWVDKTPTTVATTISYTPTVTATGVYTYTATQKVGNCSSDASTVTYTILAKPAAPTITNVSVCEGATPYQITASGTNITWYDSKGVLSTGATLKPTTITGASINTYSATQTSGTCVSDKATGTLTVNALPAVTLTGTASLCSNASPITLTASPNGGTFTGAGVNATGLFDPSIVTTGANVITYSYTDANACSNNKTLSITVNSSANPTATGSSCLVGAASIPAMIASGSGTIQWYSSLISTTVLATGNSYVPTISTGTAGTTTFYVENLTASGCTSGRVPVTVTISNCSTVAPTVTSATICEGDAAGTLQATGTGIIWYDGKSSVPVGSGATYKPADKTAGIYTYYASQTTTCESPKTPATYTINGLPSVSFPAVSPLCFNAAPLTLSASPANGTFTGTGVANGKLTPSQAIAGDISVTYSYTDATTNCSAKAIQTITVSYVAPPTVNPSTNITQVNVAPALFNATGSGVLWYSDASLLSNVSSGPTFQAPTVFNTGTTTFYLTQTVNSCTSNAALAVVSVTSCATGLPTVTNAESCIGATTKALTASGSSLQWYSDVALTSKISVATPTSFVPTIDVTKPGITTFYVTQTSGCEGPAVAVTYTVNALPVVTLDIVPAVCSSVTTASALVGSPTGGTFSGAVSTASFTPSVLGIGQHTVTYSYSNANSCVNTATQTITINDCSAPKVSSITITPSLTVNVNATGTVSVLQLLPSGASTSVTWFVSSTDTASVKADGTVTGLKAGTTSIVAKATDGSGVVSNKCIVTVKSIIKPVTSITFSNTSPISITETGTIDLSTYLVLNPTDATIASITWTSLNPTVADVNATTGVVSGKAVSADATAVIQVSVLGTDGYTTTTTITISVIKNAVLVTSVKLDASTMSIEVGKTGQLTATVSPTSATVKTVSYSSSDASIAKVDATTGLVTAVKAGKATIIVTTTDGGFIDPCVVTVTDIALTQITFSSSIVDCPATGTLDLSTYIGFIPTTAADKNINWSIDASQSSLASVNLTSGLFTPIATSGVIDVTATNPVTSVKAIIKVNITTIAVSVTGVTITPADTTLKFNQNKNSDILQFSAVVAPKNATTKTVSWTLTKTTSGQVAIDQTGNVTISGIQGPSGNGTITVKAISTDGGIVGTATINVVFKYKVESVKITTLATTINQASTLQLSADETPLASLTGKPIVWSIKNTSTVTDATISSTGLLTTGAMDGTVVVVATVTDDDGMVYTNEVIITVKTVVNLTGITVNGGISIIDLKKGDTKIIDVAYLPANTGQTGVTYISSNPNVVSVNKTTGEVIANLGGTATITVTPSANLLLAKTITVNVEEKVSSLSIVGDNNNADVVIDNKVKISITINDPTATNQTLNVLSSDKTIASLIKITNTEWDLTALAEGTVTISASALDGSNQTASLTIKVVKTPVTGITIAQSNQKLEVGQTFALVATIIPVYATFKDVTWTSSDQSIATITNAGLITGISEGNVTFTVTSVDNIAQTKTVTFDITKKALERTVLDSLVEVGSDLWIKKHAVDPKNNFVTILYNKTLAAKSLQSKLDDSTTVGSITQPMIIKAVTELQIAIDQVNCNCYVAAGEVEAFDVTLYPNPVIDVLNVRGESIESVQIFNLNGKSIINTTSSTIDMSGYPAGSYEVIIKSKSEVSIQTIIKE